MKQNKQKPLINRKETQILLTTLKMATTAGALSLTIGGWSLLAQLETLNIAQAAANQPQPVAMVVTAPDSAVSRPNSVAATATPAPARQKISLDIVQWVQDVSGNPVAVIRDNRGSLWYVMGSDVPRLEQGLSPLVQPQLVQTTARTRAS